MRPAPDEVLHFSEDPTITRFVPHVAATARQPEAYVWAVDDARAPDYWFPRQCPRALAWVTPSTTAPDRASLGGPRVHAIEYGWLPAVQSVRLYAYRFAASSFRSFGSHAHAMVATSPVSPLGPPEPVGDLLALHEAAGIELRVMRNLWGFVDAVSASSLGFSGIRLRNARPRPSELQR
ncbi:Uncharacterised protein [Amycolatopsis camponoti]|uniref:Uncharacterized protein n=1 Tax=Amycolatopsis camponoti TaxID=2606593 RepID=A0A6I8M414_9PSEU|nr:DUF6886 family protein [Amycolatopsis camponoti]VVJ23492.1 Uncharacterised protein [Amycolatopsis camponoti]